MATVEASLSPPGPGPYSNPPQSAASGNLSCWFTGYVICPPLIIPFYQSIIFLVPMIFTLVLLFLLCIVFFRGRRYYSAQRMHQIQLQRILVTGGNLPPSVGLDEAGRAAFPIMTHAEAMAVHPKTTQVDTQCPVCLGEYAGNECLRLLPCHAFHRDCIDAWLQHHVTCPTCRTSLVQETNGGSVGGGAGEETAVRETTQQVMPAYGGV